MALTAVALAVVALQLNSEDLALIAFESDATVIKPLGVTMDISTLLRNFLEVPARGLTNIEAGLLRASQQVAKGKQSKRAVLLMTDGRHTAGQNPAYLAQRFPSLHVIQTGNSWSSPRFCRNLARAGKGKFLRVAKLEQLPRALYSLVHGIIR